MVLPLVLPINTGKLGWKANCSMALLAVMVPMTSPLPTLCRRIWPWLLPTASSCPFLLIASAVMADSDPL
jgi:hypothetical protein